VVVPLYAWAILKTRAVSRWIGWLGFVSAFVAGWLGLLAPASSAIEGITTIGFFAFFAFLLALGIALLRRDRAPAEELLPTTAQ
jgi:quinol-cytochrome oxidoreductase complex cytochrome b subunit